VKAVVGAAGGETKEYGAGVRVREAVGDETEAAGAGAVCCCSYFLSSNAMPDE
jgi:hypothetical protein